MAFGIYSFGVMNGVIALMQTLKYGTPKAPYPDVSIETVIVFLWSLCTITVNVVIFAGGKFREKIGRTFHVGVIFTILLIFPSLRHMGFIFAWG